MTTEDTDELDLLRSGSVGVASTSQSERRRPWWKEAATFLLLGTAWLIGFSLSLLEMHGLYVGFQDGFLSFAGAFFIPPFAWFLSGRRIWRWLTQPDAPLF